MCEKQFKLLGYKIMEATKTQENPLGELAAFGQSPWLDYIRRDLLTTGELKRLIDEDGLRGMTSNPAIFEKSGISLEKATDKLLVEAVRLFVEAFDKIIAGVKTAIGESKK